MDSLKKRIGELSESFGFCKFGVAEARPLKLQIKKYNEWLSKSYNVSMGWMERNLERRADVRNILAGAKSVLVFAYNYYSDFEHPKIQDSSVGKISRYAWGDDYHNVILKKLKRIAQDIDSFAEGNKSKVYVDTGPVLEAIWAERSGVGWRGKNGLILTKEYGSWIFLGVIITTAEMTYDEPIKNYCGTCSKCLDACLTNAIKAPGVVDAGRCLSYWTIEAKPDDEIPRDIAERNDGWIFGCDVCQEICPWNRFAKKTKDSSFYPRYKTFLTREQIEKLDEEEFRELYRKSPVKRAKLAGLKRNFESLRIK